MHTFFLFHYRVLNIIPVLYIKTLLFTHSKNSSLYLPTPHSQSIPVPQPQSLWQPQVWSLWVCCCFVNRFICAMFQSPHISDIIWYLSLSFWLSSLSMIISSCIHVAANGIILFFFMSQYISLYICTTTSLSICQWTFKMSPCFGYCE